MRSVHFARMRGLALLLSEAERIVAAIPYIPGPRPDGLMRCHEITRVVHAILRDEKLRVVDGFYNENCAHSWIEDENGCVLDTYAIERLPQVQVVDERSHAKKSYVEDKTVFRVLRRQDGHYADPDQALVRKLVRATEKNLKRGRTGEVVDRGRGRLKAYKLVSCAAKRQKRKVKS